MLIKVTKNNNGGYMYNGEHSSLKKIGHLIREYGNLVAETPEGYDCTKEVLIDMVFNPYLSLRNPSTKTLKLYLENFFSSDFLMEIIENGGLEQYVINKRRGLL